jgi:hypothetical protein
MAFLLAFIAAFAARAVATRCDAPATQDLAGLWETRETSKGGIGHTLELRADGTFVEAITVLVSFDYRVDGDQLSVSETPGGKPDAVTFRIAGDTLTQPGPDGAPVRKERVGKAEEGSPPLVGVWRYRHYTGGIAFERYTPDGKLDFRLPMRGSTGCFRIAGDRLSLLRRGQKETRLQFTRNGDGLALGYAGAPKPTAYERSAAGPWYDREHIDIKLPAR